MLLWTNLDIIQLKHQEFIRQAEKQRLARQVVGFQVQVQRPKLESRGLWSWLMEKARLNPSGPQPARR
jgi:hypothetical protein